MTVEVLTFGSEINFSIQVGDVLYFSPTTNVGGFNTVSSPSSIVKFGVVAGLFPNGDGNQIPSNSITCIYDENTLSPPSVNDFIMFAKDKKVNSSSLVGYYAEVEFTNYSPEKIELFSIGSEVSESSK
tara:strand:+ start:218 stop:601 length:384 start_codon:yes stop_codon:yes gene_type:complete